MTITRFYPQLLFEINTHLIKSESGLGPELYILTFIDTLKVTGIKKKATTRAVTSLFDK
jgi:hypothetical protein